MKESGGGKVIKNSPYLRVKRLLTFLLFVMPLPGFMVGVIFAAEDSSIPVEEIQVVEKRSLSQLRREITKAEDRQFDLFNSYVDDREFEIICRRMKTTRNHVKSRVCQPRFMLTRIRKSRLNDALRGQNFPGRRGGSGVVQGGLIKAPSFIALRKEELDKYLLLEEKFVALVQRYEELASAVEDVRTLKENYAASHGERFGD